MDALKSLANISNITLALVGSYDLYSLVCLNGQLARRSAIIHLSRYRSGNAADEACFRRVLAELQNCLPIAQTPDLTAFSRHLQDACVGCVGTLKETLTRALASVLEKGGLWKTAHLERALISEHQVARILTETTRAKRTWPGLLMATVARVVLGKTLSHAAQNVELDIEPTILPVRSILYHLHPIARGTALRESLSSFVLRLADQHTIAPSSLTRIPGIDRRCADPVARNAWVEPYFNATSSVARIWSSELARLTRHRSLDDLTLLSLEHVVNINALVSSTRKWYPQCLYEGERDGVPYGQLLWGIAAVEACPVHAIRLLSSCRCGARSMHAPTAKWLPHICRHCGRKLAESYHPDKASLASLQQTRQVADLLQHPDFDQCSWPKKGVSRFLIQAARIHFDGKLARLSEVLGLSKATLHGWAHHQRRPTLHRIVALTEVFGCSLRNVLQGEASQTQLRAILSLRSQRHTSPRIPPELRKRIARKLRAIQRRKPAIPVVQAARELGVSAHFLWKHYGPTCTAIVAGFQQRRAEEAAARKQSTLKLLRHKATELLLSGTRKPTLERIMGKASARLIHIRSDYRRMLGDILDQPCPPPGPNPHEPLSAPVELRSPCKP